MKRSTTRWMIAAAALVVAAGSASAQNLKADIPFTFRAGTAVMAPGTYVLSLMTSKSVPNVLMRNVDTGKAVMLANFAYGEPSKAISANGTPKLQFQCVESRCVLREMWQGYASGVYQFSGPKLGRGEEIHTAEIGMTRIKAD